MITPEDLIQTLYQAIDEVDESAYNNLDEEFYAADFFADRQELADKLKPFLAKVWESGRAAQESYEREAWDQVYSITNDQVPDPLVNPYE